MAKKLIGSVAYQPVVESISRKFVRKSDTCSHGKKIGPVKTEASGWMGGAVRKTARPGLGECTKNYLVIRSQARTSVIKPDEIVKRTIFAEAVRGRNHIVHDLMQLTQVQQKFIEARDALAQGERKAMNGVFVEGYTFYGWVMAVQYAGGKAATEAGGAAYNYNQFPTSWDA